VKLVKGWHINPWREISILMLVLMEASWVTPWFRSLTTSTYMVSSARVFLVILSTVLFAHIMFRLMDHIHLKKSIQRGLMALFIIGAIFASLKVMLYAQQRLSLGQFLSQPLHSFADLKSVIPAEFIVVLTILVAFWRGISLAQDHIGPSSVMDHFWLGIIMYVAFIFINTLATGESPEDYFFLFLFSTLIAMICSRISVIRLLRGGNENIFNRYWLAGILLAASSVVGLSALVSIAVGNHLSWIGSLFLGIFGGVLVLLWLIIGPLISIVISLLQKVFNSIGLLDLAGSLQNLNQTILGFGRNILDTINQSALSKFIQHWASALKTVILVVIIGLLVAGVVVWMGINLWQDRARRQLGGEQKSTLSVESLLRSLMDSFLNGLRNRRDDLARLTNLKNRQRLRAAARIRQVYADLMDLCTSLGQPRKKAETPLEYLPQINQLFPQLQSEARLITNAYNAIRYGQLPETQTEVDQVETSWEKIKLAGRDLSSELKQAKKK
jgi:hypothetical protein